MHAMLNIAVKAARRAGQIVTHASRNLDLLQITQKQQNDFVTEADQAAEAAIIEIVHTAYPGHAILAEESGRTEKVSDYLWIVDPLDGTTNFIHGLGQYCVSIALSYKGVVTYAVVYDPVRNDLFTASRGDGAFLNNRRLRVSHRERLSDALIGTGFPSQDNPARDKYIALFGQMTAACAGIRRMGAAALDLANVASGRLDGFFEQRLHPWDIAAGSLLVTEAGGFVGHYQGEHNMLESGEIAAGNPKLYAQMVQVLKPYSQY
jgi:myo-inositol-1(or 4)-monophosphatase